MKSRVKTSSRRFFGLCRLILVCLFALPITSYANLVPEATQLKALKLAQLIEQENLVLKTEPSVTLASLEGMPPADRAFELRRLIVGSITYNNDLDTDELIAKYRAVVTKSHSKRDEKFLEIIDAFFPLIETGNLLANLTEIEAALLPFTKDDDWYIVHSAWRFKSLVSSFDRNTSQSLDYALKAQRIIPIGSSRDHLHARIENTDHIAYLHNLQNSPALAVENTQKLIEMQRNAGDEVNGVGLLNNLIYSFSALRDYETASSLGETVIRIEKGSAQTVPGTTGLRLSKIYIELGEYEKALPHIEQALKDVEFESMRNILLIQHVIAYAGLGKVQQAELALTEFETAVPEKAREIGSLPRYVLQANALTALAKGNTNEAEKLYRQLRHVSVKSVLKANTQETSRLLATLQNSKDQQDAKEANLKRQAELKQEALDKQQHINQLLILVLAGLLLTVVGAIAFAQYRSRVAAKMQTAFKKAEAGEKAKSEFLAVMSHELRTPLNGVLGMADLLVMEAPTPAILKKSEIILQSGHDLLGLVENILDMTLIEGGDQTLYPEKTNISELTQKVEKTWRPIIEKKDIQFTVFVDPKIPDTIIIDDSRTEKTLTHLISNSAKFTLAGRIHLHVMSEVQSADNSCKLKFIIADTGAGISESAQVLLFKPFVQADSSMTRQFGGAGLGLAIARSTARLMGGDITYVSREGKGSEFTLTLEGSLDVAETVDSKPKTKSKRTALKETSQPPVLDTSISNAKNLTGVTPIAPYNILIVEDDKSCQKVLRTLLEPTGCSVSCASTGKDGLGALTMETFDLVIMDIRMPGMDGITAIRRIRASHQAHKNVPIIALTADVGAETSARCEKAGVNAFLTKPIKSAQLLGAIAKIQNKIIDVDLPQETKRKSA